VSGLTGRTVLVTREAAQAAGLAEELRARGARVIESAVIAFEDPADWGPADAAIASLAIYQHILFTSANAADRFARRLRSRAAPGAQPALPVDARVTAIGPATAAAARAAFGVPVDEVSADFRAEGLVRHMESRGDLAGTRVLLPRAEVAREVLPEALRAGGARVDVVPVYRTVPCRLAPEVARMLAAGAVDVVTFTSASTVRHFLAAVGGSFPPGAVAAVIGPVTADAARAAGVEPAIEASQATMASLAEAIAAHFGG
jgi:uroporphyrinogen III methyltransferase/synthase